MGPDCDSRPEPNSEFMCHRAQGHTGDCVGGDGSGTEKRWPNPHATSAEGAEESLGSVTFPDGPRRIVGLMKVVGPDRDAMLLEIEDGSYVVQTKSWLPENGRREIVQSLRLSKGTLMVLFQTLQMASVYFNLDVVAEMMRVTLGSEIRFEYGGHGPFGVASMQAAGAEVEEATAQLEEAKRARDEGPACDAASGAHG